MLIEIKMNIINTFILVVILVTFDTRADTKTADLAPQEEDVELVDDRIGLNINSGHAHSIG